MPTAAPDYKPPPKRKTAAQWNEEWDGKDAGMPQPFGDHFKGESGGLTHAEKYKLQRSAEGGKGGGAQAHGGPKEIDGRVLRIAGPPDRGAGETWNDLMWALAFFVVFGYTVFVAIYANTRPEEVEVVDVCTADSCVSGACGDGQSCVDGRCACDAHSTAPSSTPYARTHHAMAACRHCWSIDRAPESRNWHLGPPWEAEAKLIKGWSGRRYIHTALQREQE